MEQAAHYRSLQNRIRTVLMLLRLLVFGRAQQTIDQTLATNPHIGCRAGCAHCCYQNVEVTIPEAILAATHLADPADPRRPKLLETASALRGMTNAERRRTGRPCPLLVDNRCSIYEDRPLACRGMLASDPEECRASNESAFAGRGDLPFEH